MLVIWRASAILERVRWLSPHPTRLRWLVAFVLDGLGDQLRRPSYVCPRLLLLLFQLPLLLHALLPLPLLLLALRQDLPSLLLLLSVLLLLLLQQQLVLRRRHRFRVWAFPSPIPLHSTWCAAT